MTDQQLANRFEAAELPAWENDATFQQLLLSFESILRSGCLQTFVIRRFINESLL